jgi:pimeloyl-ACP methyl ester carboxylesterase
MSRLQSRQRYLNLGANLLSRYTPGSITYVGRFTSLTQLTSSSGLSISATGGIVASVSNVEGTANLALPVVLNSVGTIFRFAVLLEVNDDFNTQVQLANPSGDYRSGAYLSVRTSGIQMFCGGVAEQGAGFNSIAPGTRVWFMMAGDGSSVTYSMSTLNPTGISSGEPFQGTAFNKLYTRNRAATFFSNDYPVFSTLTRILITSRSSQNRVLGVFCNVGSWDFPNNDGLLNPPAIAITQVLNDKSPYVMISGNYGTADAKTICFHHHPNSNSGNLFDTPTEHTTKLQLWTSGYTCIGMSGLGNDPTTFTEATMSPWNAPAGMYYRRYFVEYVRNLLPRLTQLVHLGSSMGGLIAFGYQRAYGGARAIVTVSGSVGLADSYNSGFNNIVQKAFGDWYVCIQAGNRQNPVSSPASWTRIATGFNAPPSSYYPSPFVWRDVYNTEILYEVNDIVVIPLSGLSSNAFNDFDPTTNVSRYVDIPISMYHSSNDTLIPISQMNTFASNLITNGGNVITQDRGTGHITADVYDNVDIINFFNSTSS